MNKAESISPSMLQYLASIIIILILAMGFPSITVAAGEKPWSAEAHVKRYFSSHTSYEFGNPDPPGQAPLSRLEFPMNTWWVGGEVRRRFSRMSIGVEVLGSIPMESDLAFKDSDWTGDRYPTNVKDIYSEAQCRVEASYMVRGDIDLKIADWVGLPVWFDLRPVAGVRWQNLNIVAHNGVQIYPGPGDTRSPEPMPDDVIRFEQNYWQYFVGIRTAYDLERHIKLPGLKMLCQLDWAYVKGDNKDNHPLRGNRWTYEKTSGDAWHASIGLKADLTKNIDVGVEFEYLRIQTTGSHTWVHDEENANQTWDNGVKVWSEQMSLMMTLGYKF
jgi:outer membrane protease